MAQQTANNKSLFKILAAVAWIDGEVQPEERKFLEKIATEHDLESVREIQDLLSAHRATSPAKCYELLEEYLGSNPHTEDYHNLLSAVSTLVYSDDHIDTEEAKLLTKIQNLDPNNLASHSALDKLINKIQQVYQAGLSAI